MSIEIVLVVAVSAVANVAAAWSAEPVGLQFTLIGHKDEITCVVFAPDGKTVASASRDGTVKLWDAFAGKCVATLVGSKDVGEIGYVAFSRDGRRLASSCWEGVWFWDVASRKQTASTNANPFLGRGPLWFQPNSNTLVAVHRSCGKFIEIYDASNGKQTNEYDFNLPGYGSGPLAFRPDGKLVAWETGESIKLCDMATGKRITTFPKGHRYEVTALAFSPDGEILASGNGDQTIKLWKVASGTCIATLQGDHGWDLLGFSPDGKMLVSGKTNGGDAIVIWDLATGKTIGQFSVHQLSCLAVSPDSKTLATGCDDKTIRLWDLTKATNKTR